MFAAIVQASIPWKGRQLKAGDRIPPDELASVTSTARDALVNQRMIQIVDADTGEVAGAAGLPGSGAMFQRIENLEAAVQAQTVLLGEIRDMLVKGGHAKAPRKARARATKQ